MSSSYRKLQVFTKTSDFRAATKVVEVPLEAPTVGQVRVRIIYAGVNASDINMTAARYFVDGKIPFDIGAEAIGVVDALGDGASSQLKVGQAVLATGLGAFSEYTYCKPDSLVPLPELNPKYLVSYVTGLTAAIGLDRCGRIETGDKVLITAAAGGTGQIAVQWAKAKGCYVIGLTSSETKAQFLRELGVDLVINYRTENVDQVLTEKFPEGVDVIWETVGGETFKMLFSHLAVCGRLVIIGSIHSYKEVGMADIPIENLNQKLLTGSRTLTGFMLLNWSKVIPQYLKQLIGQISSGAIKATVDLGESSTEGKFFGIEAIARAEDHLHQGANKGKVVVQIQNA